jgi:hypothetical protein
MLKEGKSITNYEPQSLIAKTVITSHHHHHPQYSSYVINAIGVQPVLIIIEYRVRISAHSVMRMIMN